MAKGICSIKRELLRLNELDELRFKICKFMFMNGKIFNIRSDSHVNVTNQVRNLVYGNTVQTRSYLQRLGILYNKNLFHVLQINDNVKSCDVVIRDGVYHCMIHLHTANLDLVNKLSHNPNNQTLNNVLDVFNVTVTNPSLIDLTLGKPLKDYSKYIKRYRLSHGEIIDDGDLHFTLPMKFKECVNRLFGDVIKLYDDKIERKSIDNKRISMEIELANAQIKELQAKIESYKLDIQCNEDIVKKLIENKNEKIIEMVTTALK